MLPSSIKKGVNYEFCSSTESKELCPDLHRDYLCRKWCNPAPLNGSAPNLVVVENDAHGNPHYKCAFNTQV
jgi:hypothetical protein